MAFISIVCGTFNEEDNVEELYERVKRAFLDRLPDDSFEMIVIDNASTDSTVAVLKRMAEKDKRLKIIVNNRDFGHIRSPVHAILQARGDAVIAMTSDLQDPPELIPELVTKWREGYSIVAGVKPKSIETPLMFVVRRFYYRVIGAIADVELIKNFTGFGLYDRSVIEVIRKLDDPYPYFRGIISELGFRVAQLPYTQRPRVRGITKNNFYTLYDLAMLGITSHSKVPLRLATMAGFALSLLSLAVSLTYLVLKLMFWDQFGFGTAPILIGLFFFFSVQLFFIGLLGEYVAAIHTQVLKRPLVIERERVNFDDVRDSGGAPPR
ncbi:MAG: dolichol monophosphate mannose synthase [Betaproteobacteria bacterium RIFCSPLOWO2_12_FULL_65_14]|nr:MAG: dolichol monophosphate mannose synthase [Betaproteobacteria bacterium RIFCSPLOWO2_12_FULL_65_14]